ncbi:protein-tyrosine phosphatase family protein [Streptomyces abyssomicinicus]|uniref:protein-tyrosine phosphatase family protein n=1 Tax=Streptomyces abyssomicinicus TaxID=574929 RepID=UPI0012508A6A|nr:dual specificity protein phosphatase family protein [Streptomyces abyssomicinicus]
MRTRQKHHDAPEPDKPWNEITPGLWMGGHFWADRTGEVHPAVAGEEFDLVISLFTREGHGPHQAAQHLITELPDGPLTADQIHSVQELARAAAHALRDGRTVLVRCHSGYNRSGLVIAQTLVELGHTPDTAISLIRQRRSPRALNNETFEQYLTTGLHVAYLLSGLDTLG